MSFTSFVTKVCKFLTRQKTCKYCELPPNLKREFEAGNIVCRKELLKKQSANGNNNGKEISASKAPNKITPPKITQYNAPNTSKSKPFKIDFQNSKTASSSKPPTTSKTANATKPTQTAITQKVPNKPLGADKNKQKTVPVKKSGSAPALKGKSTTTTETKKTSSEVKQTAANRSASAPPKPKITLPEEKKFSSPKGATQKNVKSSSSKPKSAKPPTKQKIEVKMGAPPKTSPKNVGKNIPVRKPTPPIAIKKNVLNNQASKTDANKPKTQPKQGKPTSMASGEKTSKQPLKSTAVKKPTSPPTQAKSSAGVKKPASPPAAVKSKPVAKKPASPPAAAKSSAGAKKPASPPAAAKSSAGAKKPASPPTAAKSSAGAKKPASPPTAAKSSAGAKKPASPPTAAKSSAGAKKPASPPTAAKSSAGAKKPASPPTAAKSSAGAKKPASPPTAAKSSAGAEKPASPPTAAKSSAGAKKPSQAASKVSSTVFGSQSVPVKERKTPPSSPPRKVRSKESSTKPLDFASGEQRKLFTPGPLMITDRVKSAMLLDIARRHVDFTYVNEFVRVALLQIARLSEDDYSTMIMEGTCSTMIEMTLRTMMGVEGKKSLLIMSNGLCGDRVEEICKADGVKYSVIPMDNKALSNALQTDEYHGVFAVHCEKSTGKINPISEIGKTVKNHSKEIMYFVDATMTFGSVPFDASNIDFLISTSGRSLHSTQDIVFLIGNNEMMNKHKEKNANVLIDLGSNFDEVKSKNNFQFKQPNNVMLAFKEALLEFSDDGSVAGRSEKYKKNNKIMVDGMEEMGFKRLFTTEENPDGYLMTVFEFPNNPLFVFTEFYNRLSDKGFVIMSQNATQNHYFGIANMGDLDEEDMKSLVKNVHQVCTDMRIEIPLHDRHY